MDGTNQLLTQLITDPERFAATVYSYSKNKLYSPYLQINSPGICCLEGQSCLIQEQIPLQKGKEGQTYRVVIDDLTYVLKVDLKVNPKLEYSRSAPQRPTFQKYQYTDLPETCFYRFGDLDFLKADNFTNEYLIGFLLTALYQQNPRLDGSIQFYTATLCQGKLEDPIFRGQGFPDYLGNRAQDKDEDNRKQNNREQPKIKDKNYQGHILIEYAKYGDLVKFTQNPNFISQTSYDWNSEVKTLLTVNPKVILDVFKQTVANLDFLHETVQFNHGDLKARNILVTDQPSEANYKGIFWRSEFTVKLADFGKSNLTIRSQTGLVRIFPTSKLANIYFKAGKFQPAMGKIDQESYFIVDNLTNFTAYANIRHMGNPYYYSFDTYTFLTSLYLIPGIFYPIMSNPVLRVKLWEDLWFPEELDLINSRLYPAVGKPKFDSYNTVVTILRGLKLKCQAHQILFANLTQL